MGVRLKPPAGDSGASKALPDTVIYVAYIL